MSEYCIHYYIVRLFENQDKLGISSFFFSNLKTKRNSLLHISYIENYFIRLCFNDERCSCQQSKIQCHMVFLRMRSWLSRLLILILVNNWKWESIAIPEGFFIVFLNLD